MALGYSGALRMLGFFANPAVGLERGGASDDASDCAVERCGGWVGGLSGVG